LDKSFAQFILIAPVLLFSMVAHEYAHGYAALKQGDPTAYSLGRLTWNPVPHIDLFMTILLPLITYFTAGIAFGGASVLDGKTKETTQLTLSKGPYVLVCFLTDRDGKGKPHFQEGLLSQVTVR